MGAMGSSVEEVEEVVVAAWLGEMGGDALWCCRERWEKPTSLDK